MSNLNCLFCGIANKKVHSEVVYEDEQIIAFKDVKPTVRIHIILIPKVHIANLNELTFELSAIVGHIALVAKKLAEQYEIASTGYKLLSNCGEDAGQTVYHLHFHLLGGELMTRNNIIA